jgi:hypothetical protein
MIPALAIGLALALTGATLSTPSSAQGLVPCAPEGGYCRVPYPTRVIYGVPGRTTSIEVRGRGVPCTNEVFGDPARNVPKRCAYVARGGGIGEEDEVETAPRWRTCARENGYCDFQGRRRVRYGAVGRFVEGTYRDGVDCDNDTFGDPAPGVPKVCQVLER